MKKFFGAKEKKHQRKETILDNNNDTPKTLNGLRALAHMDYFYCSSNKTEMNFTKDENCDYRFLY